MIEVTSRRVETLTAQERDAVMQLFSSAYELSVPAETLMRQYGATVPMIFLGREAGELIGFQFYRSFNLNGLEVFQFSLAGKASHYKRKGLQRAFGKHLMRRSLKRFLNPFRQFAIVGVSNNPKTYKNMLMMGGEVFPDVIRPGSPFKYRGLYEQVAQHLEIQGLELSTGIVRDRCGSLGLKLKQTAFESRDDAVQKGFMEYIDGDVNHGILTMVVSSPVVSARALLARQVKLWARDN